MSNAPICLYHNKVGTEDPLFCLLAKLFGLLIATVWNNKPTRSLLCFLIMARYQILFHRQKSHFLEIQNGFRYRYLLRCLELFGGSSLKRT